MINAVDRMLSKTIWRTLVVFAIFVLLANLLKPADLRLHRLRVWYDTNSQSHSTNAAAALNSSSTLPNANTVDWSQFAYCQYVTTEPYLCNSVMIFETLSRLVARADRLMLYPEQWDVTNDTWTGKLLLKAQNEYSVRLVPITVQHFDGESTWADSFTKLLAFNQTDYKRVLSLDSDSTVLQPMDELFLLPSAPVAMPRAYWLDDTLSSQLVLVEPSKFEFERIQHAFANRTTDQFDMDIVNDIYGDDCLIIPHRRYNLITGEFRAGENRHAKYLGSKEEQWDPDRILKEAKFLHFSDWPVNKPWFPTAPANIDENMPKCIESTHGTIDCRDQELWIGFYDDFRERRSRVCGVDVH